MRTKSTETFYIVAYILLVATCAILSWKYFIPKYKADVLKLKLTTAEVLSAQKKLETLERTQTSLADATDDVKQALIAVPSDKDMPNLITEIGAIAKINKTEVPTMQVTDGDNHTTLITFAVTGQFADMVNLLTSLESDVKVFNLKSVAMSITSKGMVQLSVQMNGFKRINTSLSGN